MTDSRKSVSGVWIFHIRHLRDNCKELTVSCIGQPSQASDMAGDSYSSCIGTSRTNGIRSISKKDLYMIPTILSVAAKRDRICPALHGLCLFLFQGIQQAGRFRFFWLHGYREGRVLITESAYLKRTRRKRFHTVVRDRQDFRHHGSYAIPTVQPIRAGRVSNFFPLKLMHAPLSTRRSSWCRKASATTEASRKVSGLESRFHSWTGRSLLPAPTHPYSHSIPGSLRAGKYGSILPDSCSSDGSVLPVSGCCALLLPPEIYLRSDETFRTYL